MKYPMACMALALGLLLPPAASAQISVSIRIAPPALLVYAQPPVPGDGYIWVPGYWGWSHVDRAYYWVPGTWVQAPHEGALWTPGYWAFESSGYLWHVGYWGSRVGFYGGINYGYGYSGSGYKGGRWDHGAFRYNRAVSNVDTQVVRHVYGAPPIGNASKHVNRVSFSHSKAVARGRPTASEREFQAAPHAGPSDEQIRHEDAARGMPSQRWRTPRGLPQVAATPRPSEYAPPHSQAQVQHQAPTPRGQQQRQSPRGSRDDDKDQRKQRGQSGKER
jgi:WXXGXW repeat (2 copies)